MPMFLGKNLAGTRWHPSICPQLDSMSASNEISDRALSENLGLEKRVAQERVEAFLEHFDSHGGQDAFANAILSFRKKAPSSAVGLKAHSNIAYRANGGDLPQLSDRTQLVTIQWLFPGFIQKIQDWLKQRLPLESISPGAMLDELVPNSDRSDILNNISDDFDVHKWLQFASGKHGRVPSLVRQSLAESWQNFLRDNQTLGIGSAPLPQDRLCWVGLWDEFEPHAAGGIARWLEMFGLGHYVYANSNEDPSNAGRDWFLVLKYSAADTSYLLRPTVLEAGENPWFYPFRADFPAIHGGKTVVFGELLRRRIAPPTEFIHIERVFLPQEIWAIEPRVSLLSKKDGKEELAGARQRQQFWIQSQAP